MQSHEHMHMQTLWFGGLLMIWYDQSRVPFLLVTRGA